MKETKQDQNKHYQYYQPHNTPDTGKSQMDEALKNFKKVEKK